MQNTYPTEQAVRLIAYEAVREELGAAGPNRYGTLMLIGGGKYSGNWVNGRPQ